MALTWGSGRALLALLLLPTVLAGCFRLGFQPRSDAETPGLEPREGDGHVGQVDRAVDAGAPRDASAGDRAQPTEGPHPGDLPRAMDAAMDKPHADKPRDTSLADMPLAKDLSPIDTKAADKVSPPKDAPPLDKPPAQKDGPPKDLVKVDLKVDTKIDTKVDTKPMGEPQAFNPNGTYTITPQVTYKCALSVVNFTIDWTAFVDNASTLMVTTGPTGPKGGCSVLTGDTAFDGSFTATCTYAGSCNEIYTLTGSFAGNNWTGTYTATFNGSCLNCANQSWPVSGARQ